MRKKDRRIVPDLDIDFASIPETNFHFEGTDVEVVCYRTGDTLVLICNKGPAIMYRATLHGIFKEIDGRRQYPISAAFKLIDIDGSLSLRTVAR